MTVTPPHPLLMTATITPPENAPRLARSDPHVRLRDYETSLKFYLSTPNSHIDRIVFAENSGSSLDSLKRIAMESGVDKKVEFISFYDLDYPPAYGRAYGELRLMQHAMATSRLLGTLDRKEMIWKVTGRLRVVNINRLVKSTPASADLYIEFKRHPVKTVHLRVYACSHIGFESHLFTNIEELREDRLGGTAESRLYELLQPVLHTGRIVPRLRYVPLYRGYGATQDRNYGSLKANLKDIARTIFRRTAPGFWV